MKQFKRILVGLDLTSDSVLTQGSRRAAIQAQWLAEKSGASLTFLHSRWSDLYEESGRYHHGLSADTEAALKAFAAEYAESGTPVDLDIVDERPWIEICRRAKDSATDLVVVGRTNVGGAKPFGSTAKKLMRNCAAPVWVVKPEADLLHRSVLAATDLSDVGDRATEMGAFIAGEHDCDFQVAHAWQLPMSLVAGRESDAEQAAEKARIQESAEAHIRGLLDRVAPGLDAKLLVTCDNPSRLIREAVDKLDVDLLVMGTMSRTGIPGLLVGNTAERILEKVQCSVLTIKPDGFESPVH